MSAWICVVKSLLLITGGDDPGGSYRDLGGVQEFGADLLAAADFEVLRRLQAALVRNAEMPEHRRSTQGAVFRKAAELVSREMASRHGQLFEPQVEAAHEARARRKGAGAER